VGRTGKLDSNKCPATYLPFSSPLLLPLPSCLHMLQRTAKLTDSREDEKNSPFLIEVMAHPQCFSCFTFAATL
jgi:hypothetical protein